MHGGGPGGCARRRGGASTRVGARARRRGPGTSTARRAGRPALTLSRAALVDTVDDMRTAIVWGAVLAVCFAAGQAGAAAYSEEDFFAKPNPSYTIPTPVNGAPTTVIGEVRMYRIRQGDTLMDLARLFSLGYNEIVE